MDVSDDGLVYTFHLRKDAKWSDGQPVTAADYEYGWKRLLNPEYGYSYSFYLFNVEEQRSIITDRALPMRSESRQWTITPSRLP